MWVRLLPASALLLLGWRVGVWLSDPEICEGSEETPPTRRIAPPLGGKPRGLATEQKRHVHPDLAMRHAIMPSAPEWNGETAVLQVERANSRR